MTARNAFYDLWQVGHCHVTVKKVIRLNQDANTARALVEATRGARAGPKLRQAARGQLLLQGQANLFRALVGTRSLFVLRTPAVRADEEVTLSLRIQGGCQPIPWRSTVSPVSQIAVNRLGQSRPVSPISFQILESSGQLSASQRKDHL